MLNDYINHMKMELYGRGETMIQVGAGSEGEDGDGQSQTFLYKYSNFSWNILQTSR